MRGGRRQRATARRLAFWLGPEPGWLMADGRCQPAGVSPVRCQVLVLGREHYQEMVLQVPMSTRQEIGNAISFDPESFLPPDPQAAVKGSERIWFFRRLLGFEESTTINLWVVNESSRALIEACEPLWIIPESAVLHGYEERLQWRIARPGGSRMLAAAEVNGAVRSLPVVDDDGAGMTELEFARIIGGEFPARREIEVGQWSELLIERIFDGASWPWEIWPRLLRHWRIFRYRDGWRRRFGDRRRLRLTSGLVAGLLLLALVTQLLLPWSLRRAAEDRLAGSRPEVEQLFKLKEKLQHLETGNTRLLEVVRRRFSTTAVLNLVSRVLTADDQLFNFTLDDDRVELSGETADGSKLLQRLSREPLVQGARFLRPLRKKRSSKRQFFKVGFRVVAVESHPATAAARRQ